MASWRFDYHPALPPPSYPPEDLFPPLYLFGYTPFYVLDEDPSVGGNRGFQACPSFLPPPNCYPSLNLLGPQKLTPSKGTPFPLVSPHKNAVPTLPTRGYLLPHPENLPTPGRDVNSNFPPLTHLTPSPLPSQVCVSY